MDWRRIENDKEKYAAYLCSREWAEKREAVRERAYDKCERCFIRPMDAVHHLTYQRKYDERLDDLQAICNLCHEFTHGKSSDDPAKHTTTLQLEYFGDAVDELRYMSSIGCPRCEMFGDIDIRDVESFQGKYGIVLRISCDCLQCKVGFTIEMMRNRLEHLQIAVMDVVKR